MKNDHLNSTVLDDETTRRLHELCTRLYDEVISNEEFEELNRLLDSKPAARQFYLQYVSLHNMLLGSVGKHQRMEAELLGQRIDTGDIANTLEPKGANASFGIESKPEPARRVSYPSVTFHFPAVRTGIAFGLFITTLLIIWRLNSPSDITSSVERSHPLARVSYVSTVANDKTGKAPILEDWLYDGNVVDLLDGEVELTYQSGTKMLVIGPAKFVVGELGGKLIRGGIMAAVTEKGQGFTVEVPDGRVVDLGTEFGVAVDDFGVSEVGVFDGKVEAFPSISTTKAKKIELLKGEGLQWNQNRVTTLNADLRKFASSVFGRQFDSTARDKVFSQVDHFDETRIDPVKWNSLGDVRCSDEGLTMKGAGDPSNRPYLVSTEQFNPLEGAVTVICDFRFNQTDEQNTPAFSILTRCDDQRGVAPKPWHGSLASGVRCGYRSTNDLKQGLLQAGVKLEPDREMINVSWSGFQSPTIDTNYRMIMRDDGVNVSLKVSLLDNPSVHKTITCRSLFQGKSNHVALEGMITGTTIVDRIEITQDQTGAALSNYADFCSLVRNDSVKQRNLTLHLEDLAPPNAKLIQSDDFNDNQLDGVRWQTLGHVAVHDGLAELGEHNEEARIDTWKSRPYLLTRDKFDPSDRALTVSGIISFAENFLDGYGASFAVLTRANNERGNGPGWENSVLQRGVRANFWPASIDQDHSLEIHEKPEANTITLLAKKGAEVAPTTRTYLFRVVDNGNSVNLTILDPDQPKNQITVSAQTTADLHKGFIAFESCWGSPVKLHEVRIYQSLQTSGGFSKDAED